ncbi:D-xylose 1-dehydrogenase Gfo6 (plasmid) [Haloferacaceae archaeon DSL9]
MADDVLSDVLDGYHSREWQTVSDGTVRFALVGLGWWTTAEVIPAIEDSELCRTTVVVSGSAEKANRIVDDHDSIERGLTYEAFHDGEAVDAYDAVYVCTPNAHHLEYVRTAAARGKPVLCEKPMEATAERARELVAVCEDNDTALMIGYRMQTDPVVRYARDLVRAGAIGRPVHALGNNSQRLLDIIPDPDQWRLDPDVTGYGASVMDLGVYPLNTARFILDADPVRVQATLRSSNEAFDEVPDEVSAFTAAFDDGTILSATATQNAHASTSLRIIGTEGQLAFEPAFHMETDLKIERGDDEVSITPGGVNQMTELFDYFADRILGGERIEPNGAHGLVDLEALRAIYEAGETGDAIAVGE